MSGTVMQRLRSRLDAFRAQDRTEDRLDEASDVHYPPIDEVVARLRPDELADAHHELAAVEDVAEQRDAFAAEGEAVAEAHDLGAARVQAPRDAAVHAAGVWKGLADRAAALLTSASDALAPYVTRGPHDTAQYEITRAALLLGDVAGISMGMILLGEIPALAILQSVAAAAAAVTSGRVGTEMRTALLVRRRAVDPAQLPAELRPYERLFSAERARDGRARGVLWVGAAIVLLVGAGVFSLRYGAEGTASAFLYGPLAVAICLASYINSYLYADDVADLLAGLDVRLRRALKAQRKAAAQTSIAEHAVAVRGASIARVRYQRLGEAAGHRLLATMHRASMRNPSVFGHGRRRASAPALFDLQAYEADLHRDDR